LIGNARRLTSTERDLVRQALQLRPQFSPGMVQRAHAVLWVRDQQRFTSDDDKLIARTADRFKLDERSIRYALTVRREVNAVLRILEYLRKLA